MGLGGWLGRRGSYLELNGGSGWFSCKKRGKITLFGRKKCGLNTLIPRKNCGLLHLFLF